MFNSGCIEKSRTPKIQRIKWEQKHTLAFDLSNESQGEVFLCVSVHYILQGGFNHKLTNHSPRNN